MKLNKKTTKKVRDSIKDFRKTIINATIELCRQIDKYEQGDMLLDSYVPIVKTSVKEGVIITHSFLAQKLYFRYNNDYYFVKKDDASANSFDMSLDSLVAVYDAVKKTVSNH